MKTLRINRIKAFFRKYKSSKRVAVQDMYRGDLNAYMNSLLELSESKQKIKNTLVPAVARIS